MSTPQRLVNTTSRPVEVHLSHGAVVIPAHGETTCDEAELELGHLAELRRTGVLVVRPAAAEESAPAEPKPTPTRTPKPARRGRATPSPRRGGKT
jgi:hypothetical protein